MKPNSTPKFVPLNNLQSEIVEANLVLPAAAGLDQLGVDIIRLETLCRVAGIRKLTIRNKKSEPEGTTIAGRNNDGTAMGSLMGSKAISTSSQESSKGLKVWTHTEANIEIDIAMLANKISEKFPEGVRSLNGWSEELEEIITKHVGDEGLKFLLAAEKETIIMDMMVTLFAYVSLVLAHRNILVTVIVAIMARLTGYEITSRIAKKIRVLDTRMSPLSIGGIEWDRALVLIGMIANTRNLIGKISQEVQKEG